MNNGIPNPKRDPNNDGGDGHHCDGHRGDDHDNGKDGKQGRPGPCDDPYILCIPCFLAIPWARYSGLAFALTLKGIYFLQLEA